MTKISTTAGQYSNILYRFENIQKYWYVILQASNIEISELRYQLQYRFKVVLYYIVLKILLFS